MERFTFSLRNSQYCLKIPKTESQFPVGLNSRLAQVEAGGSRREKTLIEQNHFQEWQQSAVDEQIIKLNVKSLDGEILGDCDEESPLHYLLYNLPRDEHTNPGFPRGKYYNRLAHCDLGGFWVAGINVLTGEPSDWGQFKPDNPRSYEEKPKGFDPSKKPKIKTIKYENPPKADTEVF